MNWEAAEQRASGETTPFEVANKIQTKICEALDRMLNYSESGVECQERRDEVEGIAYKWLKRK